MHTYLLTLIIVVSLQIFSVLNSDASAPALETQPQGDEEGELRGTGVCGEQSKGGPGPGRGHDILYDSTQPFPTARAALSFLRAVNVAMCFHIV